MRKISMKRKSKTFDLNSTNTSENKDALSDNESIENEDNSEDGRKTKKNRRSKKSIAEESNGTEKKSSKKKVSNDNEETYEVEQILDEKNIKGNKHFLIRWKGYTKESDTWEPESTLNCPEVIDKFYASKEPESAKKKRRSKQIDEKSKKSKIHNDDSEEEEKEFEVDRIIEVHFKKNGKREFLVHWKGYSQSENTWEPEENMNCPDLIDKFMAKVNKAREMDTRELRVNRAPTDRFTLSMVQSGRRLSRRNLGKQRAHYFDFE